MAPDTGGIPFSIPALVWRDLMEIRSNLDAACPGPPTPVEEALREVVDHYRRCPRTQEELSDFCRRAQAWKKPAAKVKGAARRRATPKTVEKRS